MNIQRLHKHLFFTPFLAKLCLLGILLFAFAERGFADNTATGFTEAVQAYRTGQYRQAESLFTTLHEQAPDQSNVTYYLALIKTQLGDFRSAQKLHEEVTLLDPNSEAARLSGIALQQLASLTANPKQKGFHLDPPPDISRLNDNKPTQPANTETQNPYPQQSGMSPQELMALQMMMGSMGNGNNTQGNGGMGNIGGLNPMLMQSMLEQQNPNGQQNIDPNVLSTMMMNQMLQNFSLDSKQNNQNE